MKLKQGSGVKLEPLQYYQSVMGGQDLEPKPMTARTTKAAGGAPIWRKTRLQKVDDKVENILESYRLVDQVLVNSRAKRE